MLALSQLVPGQLYEILIIDYNIIRSAMYYGLRKEHTQRGIDLHPEFDAGQNAKVAYNPNYIQLYNVLRITDKV
jgi:hypothetical protein